VVGSEGEIVSVTPAERVLWSVASVTWLLTLLLAALYLAMCVGGAITAATGG